MSADHDLQHLPPVRLAAFWGGLAAAYSLLPIASGMSVALSVVDVLAASVFWALAGAVLGSITARVAGDWLRRRPMYAWTLAAAAWAISEAVYTVLVVIKPTRWPALPYSALGIGLPALLGGLCALWALRRGSTERFFGRVHPAVVVIASWTTVAALTMWTPRWLRAFIDAPSAGWLLWGALDMAWLLTGVAGVAMIGAAAHATARTRARWIVGGALLVSLQLVPLAIPAASERGVAAAGSPDLVWIMVDSARADHIGAYGYDRATMPTFDRLAAQGMLVRNHVSAGWRTENTYAKMLPLDPALDAYHAPRAVPLTAVRGLLPAAWLPEQLGVLAALERAGYETALFHAYHDLLEDRGLQPWLQDFDHALRTRMSGDASLGAYVMRMLVSEWIDAIPRMDRWAAFRRRYLAEHVDAEVAEYLAKRSSDRPLFLIVHLAGGHSPYYAFRQEHRISTPPAPSTQIGRYDDALRAADGQLEVIVTAARRHLTNPTLFVFADHGAVLDKAPRLPAFANVPLLVLPSLGVPPDGVTSSQDIVATTLALASRSAPACDRRLGRDLRCRSSETPRVIDHTGHGRLILASVLEGLLVGAEVLRDRVDVGAADGRALDACDVLRTLTRAGTSIATSPLESRERFAARIERALQACR